MGTNRWIVKNNIWGNLSALFMTTFITFYATCSFAQTYLPNGSLSSELTLPDKKLRIKGAGIPGLETPLSELFINGDQISETSPENFNQIQEFLIGESVRVVAILENEHYRKAVKLAAEKWGGSVVAEFESRLEITIPIVLLKGLSELEGVVYVRRPLPVYPMDSSSTIESISSGSYVTQGINKSKANLWHNKGITGTGVKVAIIDYFKDYQTAQSKGELPASVTRYGNVDTVNSRHGTAVAEIVYDMAPGASMTISTPGSATQMAQYIVGLAKAGNKIISSSIGYYLDEPGDGSGSVSSAINTAANSYGTLYTQAAGNQAQFHWDGQFLDSDGNGTHNFSSQADINQLGYLTAGRLLQLYLRWNSWPTTNQDYDLYVLFWNGSGWEVVGSSENDQNGTQPPVESIVGQISVAGNYGFLINKFSANGNQILDIMGHNAPPFQFKKSDRSLIDPATSANSFSVAAVDVSTTILESYSSWGPTHGPGGALTGGIAKPRIAGFANVDTWSYGPGVFNGTSSAAPHAAGAAALIRQAFPAYSPQQTAQFLESRAVDRGASGYDYKYGYGQLSLGAPPAQPAPSEGMGFLPAIYHTLGM